jgi:hypothetical protein
MLRLATIAVLFLLAGCAGAAAPISPAAECERQGGAWRAALGLCERAGGGGGGGAM